MKKSLKCKHYYENYKNGYCRYSDLHPNTKLCNVENDYINYEPRIEVPKNFDINVIEIMKDELDSHIPTGKHLIGSSSIALCKKKNIISHLVDVKFNMNTKMLFGKIFEDVLYLPHVLSSVIVNMNQELGIKSDNMEVKPQEQVFIEVYKGYFLDL